MVTTDADDTGTIPMCGTMGAMSGILVALLNLAMFVFIARAIISWFPIGYSSPFRPVVDALYRVTDPVLVPIRRVIPPIGGLDLSVLVVIIVIQVIASRL